MKGKRIPAYNVSLDTALKQGGFYGAYGVWNSLIKIDGKILRGRVETLIFKKDQQQLYMRLKSFNKKQYRIPGGSFEKDVPNYIQAQNEVNEEARIKVKNLVNSGQHYIKLYKENSSWMNDIDSRLRWSGSYTEVYIAEYDGVYTGAIAEEDKDDDMYINGKFYNIYEIYSILSDTHRKIIDEIFPVIKKGAISESMVVIKESSNRIHYYPYYTPSEMHNIGVFNESQNRFSDIQDEALEWYLEYTDTLQNPDSENWLKELKYRYDNYIKEPILENKQLILNLGWNPEVAVTLENVMKASNMTKNRIRRNKSEVIKIDESMIFSKKDIVFNIDDFDSGKSNILLVTGISGSGKSTLSYTLAEQYNADIISLDYFQCYANIDKFNMDKDNLSYKYVDKYLLTHPKIREHAIEFSNIKLENFKSYFVPYFNWLIEELSKDKKHRYIIEGIHIMLYISYKSIKKYPLYCINTSSIKALTRHWMRDGWGIKDIVKYGYGDILLFTNWDKSYDRFKGSFEESTFTMKDFFVTADMARECIRSAHEKDQLLCIRNRDIETDDGKFNFAEYHIADKDDSKSVVAFIDEMNNVIESSTYIGKIEMPKYIKKYGILSIIDDKGYLGEATLSEAKRIKGQEYRLYSI